MIGFAGNPYPGVWVGHETTGSDSQVFYTLDDFERWLVDAGVEVKKNKWFWARSTDVLHTKVRADHFDIARRQDLLKLFAEHRTPVFLKCKGQTIINPTMKERRFQKVKGPFAAFQEIAPFISGVLGADERETVKISDKDLTSKRGHGGPYPLRKPPGGGRRR